MTLWFIHKIHALLKKYMNVHQYVCMHNLHRLMYIHTYVCTSSAVFCLAIDSPFNIEGCKTSKTSARLCDKSNIQWNADKEISEQKVGIKSCLWLLSLPLNSMHASSHVYVFACACVSLFFLIRLEPIPCSSNQSPSGMCDLYIIFLYILWAMPLYA